MPKQMIETTKPKVFAATLQVVPNTKEENNQKKMTTNSSKLLAEMNGTPELIKVLKLNYHIKSKNLPMSMFTKVLEPTVNVKISEDMVEQKQMLKDRNGLQVKLNTNKMPLTKIAQSLDLKQMQKHINVRSAEMSKTIAKKTVNINNTLPGEILNLIFRHLMPLITFPHRDNNPANWLDLARTRQVCQLWKDVAEAPGLWQKMRLKVTWRKMFGMQTLLGTWRMSEGRTICISEEGAVSEELLKMVVLHPGLHEITFSCRNLFSVDPDLLPKLVHRLEKVSMTDTRLTKQQVQNIMVGLTGETKLKRLSILKADLSSVDPDLLARAVGRLEKIELPWQKILLSVEQTKAIYTALANGDTKIKSLVVSCYSLEPELVAKAVNNLEVLGATLGSHEAEAILTQSLVKTSLKRVILRIKGPLRVDQNIVTEAKKVIKDLVVTHLE